MLRVSPLKVRVFQSCRLRYRYQYVDRLVGRLRPSDTAGSLIHRVLCDFFSKVPRYERTPDRLVAMFEAGWQALSTRFRRMPGADGFFQRGVDQLQRFAVQHDIQAEPYMVEPYLQVEVQPGILLFGRVDRIDEEPDQSLNIIDYKSGPQPDQVDAGQVRLYAIMVERKLDRPVARLSFWYLDDGLVWTSGFGDDDKRRTMMELLSAVEEMGAVTEFPPSIGPQCGHCPYLHVCEFRGEIERRRAEEGW